MWNLKTQKFLGGEHSSSTPPLYWQQWDILSSLTSSLTLLQHAYIQKQKANALLLYKDNKYQIYSLFSCVWILHPFDLTLFLSVFAFPTVWETHFLFPITIFCFIFNFPCTSIFLLLHAWLQLFQGFQKLPFCLVFPDFFNSSAVPCACSTLQH